MNLFKCTERKPMKLFCTIYRSYHLFWLLWPTLDAVGLNLWHFFLSFVDVSLFINGEFSVQIFTEAFSCYITCKIYF